MQINATTSVGSIIETESGPWLWSFTSNDGPAESRSVTITAEDSMGGRTSLRFNLTVNNLPPKATFANTSGSIRAGGTATLDFSNQTDPSTADVAASFLYSYDCTGSGVFMVENSTSPTFNCPYPLAGNYTAGGRIQDKDGGRTIYRVAVTVLPNANPVISGLDTLTLDEGSSDSILFNITDADNDPLTVNVSAGTLVQNTADEWQWTFGADDGPTDSQTVTINVSDGFGGTAALPITVTVNNLPPTAIFTNSSGDIIVGTTASLGFSDQ